LHGDPISGAIGAVVAETLAEQLKAEQEEVLENLIHENPDLNPQEILTLYEEDLQAKLKTIKLETAAIALVAGQDVQAAFEAGVTSLENNSLSLLARLAARLVGPLLGAQRAYDLYELYEEASVIAAEQGEEAALKYLAKEGAIDFAGGRVIKIGGKAYDGSKAAWKAIKAEKAQLKSAHRGVSLKAAQKGKLGEARSHAVMEFKDYKSMDCRLPRNQGIDGVFVKKDSTGKVKKIIVVESKYATKGGKPKLAWSGDELKQGKVQQLSNGWMKQQMERMKKVHPEKWKVLDQNQDKIHFKANVLDGKGINRWHDYGKCDPTITSNKAVGTFQKKGKS